MAGKVAAMLFEPMRAGLKNEVEWFHHNSKTKPGTLARLGETGEGLAAFGRGFIGMSDDYSRQPNNNVSNSGRSQMMP